ncbi:MAG: hypothetical protein J2O49_02275 [Sciscionella sp.]|nr:hypothetical protein [Sciscionella sp.]
MANRANGPDGPEDLDAAFAEIVADLEREGIGTGVYTSDETLPTLGPDADGPRGRPDIAGRRTGSDLDDPRRPPTTDADQQRPARRPASSEDASTSGTPASTAGRDDHTGPAGAWRAPDGEWDPNAELNTEGWLSDPDADDEHYVPPEPPPLPRPKVGTVIALALLVLGTLLLVAPTVIGLARPTALPFAMVCLASGIGLLVWRLRPGPPDDPTDGISL